MKARRLVVVLGVSSALVGCTLTQSEVRTRELLPAGLGRAGRLIVPKQCALKMMIPTALLGEAALNEAVWNVADAQMIDANVRRELEANGIRVGVITGEPPNELQAILDAPPPKRVDPAIVILPDGDHTLVDLGVPKEELTLLLSRDGSVAGRRYKDAKGHLRLTARRLNEETVELRIVPELHHGPVRQGWGTAPGGGSFAPQQLVPRMGQAEESFRDLTANLALQPGQIAVVGLVPERKGSLGHFLLTATEANSDRLVQKLLLIWATSSEGGAEAPIPPGLEPYEPDVSNLASSVTDQATIHPKTSP